MTFQMWSVIGCAALVATQASAGVVRGVVRTGVAEIRVAERPNPYAGRAAALPGVRTVVEGAVRDAIVYVEAIPAAADSDLAAVAVRPALAQKDQDFTPRVLAVAVGHSIDFPNQDPIYHNVFSVSPTRRFDLGKYPRGQSRRVTFPKAGLVQVFCDIHSNMAAFVLVVPNHAHTRPDAVGRYALPALPAGSYMIHAWHPDLGEIKRPIRVPGKGEVALDLDF